MLDRIGMCPFEDRLINIPLELLRDLHAMLLHMPDIDDIKPISRSLNKEIPD